MLEFFTFSQYPDKSNLYCQLQVLDEFVLSTNGSLYDDSYWSTEQFKYSLPLKEELSYVSLEDNLLVGFTIGYLYEPGWCHISRLAIHPSFQGRKIAKMMLAAQLENMLQRNPGLISVDTKKNNESAVKLYESFGFVPLVENELEAYVEIRGRNAQEYLGKSSTHFALMKRSHNELTLTID